MGIKQQVTFDKTKCKSEPPKFVGLVSHRRLAFTPHDCITAHTFFDSTVFLPPSHSLRAYRHHRSIKEEMGKTDPATIKRRNEAAANRMHVRGDSRRNAREAKRKVNETTTRLLIRSIDRSICQRSRIRTDKASV